MALLYGTDGIKQRDYRVWLIYPYGGNFTVGSDGLDMKLFISTIDGYIESCQYSIAMDIISQFIAGTDIGDITGYSEKLGECRKDSIVLTIEDGNAVEGNEVGNIVLNKNGRFTAELINATPENINLLNSSIESKIPFFIVLEEVQGQKKVWNTGLASPNDTVLSTDTHKVIFIGVNSSCVASISENLTGGSIPTVTLSVADSFALASDFRVILDVPYDLEDY